MIPPHPETRAERLVVTEQNKQKRLALAEDLDALHQTLDAGLRKVAEDHGEGISRICTLFFYNKKMKPSARPSLGNALVSYKAHQLNAGMC